VSEPPEPPEGPQSACEHNYLTPDKGVTKEALGGQE